MPGQPQSQGPCIYKYSIPLLCMHKREQSLVASLQSGDVYIFMHVRARVACMCFPIGNRYQSCAVGVALQDAVATS